MKDDFIDQSFSGLDDFYPGSKKKRREPKKPEVTPEVGWDAKPFKKFLPNGQEVDMFTIGALASALGRPIITLRSWMNEGYLPTPPYRLPTTIDKNGQERKGRRLYTRPMIEAVVELFKKNGLLYIKRVEWSNHRDLPKKIAEAWDEIRANELKTHTDN